MFSVVVPSHKRDDLLAVCLRSLKDFAPAAEVIVVDDGSKNGIISKLAANYGVRIIRHERSQGFCAAVNAGVAAASNPIVQLLNDDARVTSGYADAVMIHFDDPSVAAVTPLVVKPDGTIDTAGDEYDRGGFATKRRALDVGHASYVPLGLARWKRAPHQDVDAVSACAAFYRREALLKIGGFPEQFGAYFDDVDVSLRLRRAGYRLLLEPQSRVVHAVSQSHAPSRRLLQQQSRNEEWLYWRNAESWRTLPRHGAVLAGKLLRRLEEGAAMPWLMGRMEAIFSFPRSAWERL